MRDIGIGLIGTGFMGHARAQTFRHVLSSFSLSVRPRLARVSAEVLAGADCGPSKNFSRCVVGQVGTLQSNSRA